MAKLVNALVLKTNAERLEGSIPSTHTTNNEVVMLTFNEVKERLKTFDEITLLELLSITSEDIVNRFDDFIEDKLDQLTQQVEWD